MIVFAENDVNYYFYGIETTVMYQLDFQNLSC